MSRKKGFGNTRHQANKSQTSEVADKGDRAKKETGRPSDLEYVGMYLALTAKTTSVNGQLVFYAHEFEALLLFLEGSRDRCGDKELSQVLRGWLLVRVADGLPSESDAQQWCHLARYLSESLGADHGDVTVRFLNVVPKSYLPEFLKAFGSLIKEVWKSSG